MKFKKIIRDRENTKKVAEFLMGIYIDAVSGDPINLHIICEDAVNTGILVMDDNITSKLDEDRGLAPTVPWELYTFLDLMNKAGFEMGRCHPGSNVRIFQAKDTGECYACLGPCSGTASIVEVPVYISGSITSVPVRLCDNCRQQYFDEYRDFVDLRQDKAKGTEDRHKGIKGFFSRLFRRRKS